MFLGSQRAGNAPLARGTFYATNSGLQLLGAVDHMIGLTDRRRPDREPTQPEQCL